MVVLVLSVVDDLVVVDLVVVAMVAIVGGMIVLMKSEQRFLLRVVRVIVSRLLTCRTGLLSVTQLSWIMVLKLSLCSRRVSALKLQLNPRVLNRNVGLVFVLVQDRNRGSSGLLLCVLG